MLIQFAEDFFVFVSSEDQKKEKQSVESSVYNF